jgi:hypothetical protein
MWSSNQIPPLPLTGSGMPDALAAANTYTDLVMTTKETIRAANEVAALRSLDAPVRALASQIVGDLQYAKRDIPYRIADWIRKNVKYTQETPYVEILQGPYRTLGKNVTVQTPMGPYQFQGTGTGDCDDLSILFACLCRSIGIEAYLVGISKAATPSNYFHAMGYSNGLFYELSLDAPYGGVGSAEICSEVPFSKIHACLYDCARKQYYEFTPKNKSGSGQYNQMAASTANMGYTASMASTGADQSDPFSGYGYDVNAGIDVNAPDRSLPATVPVNALQPHYTVPFNLYAPSRQISGISMNGTNGESSPLLTRTNAPSSARRVSRMGVGDGLYAPLRSVTGMGEAPLSAGNTYTSVVFWLKTGSVNAETQFLDALGYAELPPTSVVSVKLSDAVPVLVGQIAQDQKTRRAASQPYAIGKFPIVTMAKIDDTSDLVTLTMLNVDEVGASIVYTDASFDCVDLTNYPFDSTEVSLSGKTCKVHITEGFLSDEDNQFCGLFNRLYPDATWAGLSLENKKHFALYCLESMLAATPTVDDSAGIAEYLFSMSDFQLIELYTTNPPIDPVVEELPIDPIADETPIGDETPPNDEPPIYAESTSASTNKRKQFLGLALAATVVYLATRE